MKKISLDKVDSNVVLARDLRDQNEKLLYSAGTKLTSKQISSIRVRGIKEIYVEGSDTPSEAKLFDSNSIKTLEQTIVSSFREVEDNDFTVETKRVAKRVIMDRALKKGDILTQSQLNLMNRLKETPGAPDHYVKLREMIDDPRTTGQRFIRTLELNPKISGQVCNFTATPIFSRYEGKASLDTALSIMGMQNLAELTLPFHLMSIFTGSDPTIAGIIAGLWAHCLGAGILAKIIAQRLRLKTADSLFVPVFSHDIGKALILNYCPDDYLNVENKRLDSGGASYVIENELLGYTHVDAGVILADKWKLSPLIKQVISLHHSPFKGNDCSDEIVIAHVADFLSHSLHFGGTEYPVPSIEQKSWSSLRLKMEDIEPIMVKAETLFDQVWGIFLN